MWIILVVGIKHNMKTENVTNNLFHIFLFPLSGHIPGELRT